jgi:hypothetical protein
MSGCIVFSENSGWCKAGWAYRAALEGICEALAHTGGGEELLRELTDEAEPARSLQYIEVAEWKEEKRLLFCRATLQACRVLRARGPKDWNDPSFFPGFLRALEELEACASVACDEKNG